MRPQSRSLPDAIDWRPVANWPNNVRIQTLRRALGSGANNCSGSSTCTSQTEFGSRTRISTHLKVGSVWPSSWPSSSTRRASGHKSRASTKVTSGYSLNPMSVSIPHLIRASLSALASVGIQTPPDCYAVKEGVAGRFKKWKLQNPLRMYSADDLKTWTHEDVRIQKTPGPHRRSGGFMGLLSLSNHLSGGDGGIRIRSPTHSCRNNIQAKLNRIPLLVPLHYLVTECASATISASHKELHQRKIPQVP